MAFKTVILDNDGDTDTITLNCPEQFDTFNSENAGELNIVER